MSHLQTVLIRSCDELRAVAPQWDALWQASAVTTPLARAETVAQWLEHFAPRATFLAVAISDGSRFLAALPVVGGTIAKYIPCGKLPTDPWSLNGDLLLEPGEHAADALTQLITALESAGWPVWQFESVAFDAPYWQQFRAVATDRGWHSAVHEDFRFGCVRIENWQAYEAFWSGNHRRHMRKAMKRIASEGGMQLLAYRNPPPDEIARLLQACFEVEHRSWKADAGTSVLASPGKQAYYQRLMEQMADWGCLHISLVEHCDWPIAFSLGLTAKGVYFAPKIGYDESFSRLTPGQVLFHELLKQLHTERLVESVDFWGPITDATGKWVTHDYPRGRLILAPPRIGSRTLFRALERGREYVRSLRAWRAKDAACTVESFAASAADSE